MKKLIRHLSRKRTPQGLQIPGTKQAPNHAGGYVFEVDRWQRLERFLVIGSSGGTFYVNERDLTVESAGVVMECLAEDAARTVRTIVEVSEAGRAPKNGPALLALALAFCEPTAVPFAKEALPRVARTASHLFDFMTAVRQLRGFGRALRGAIADWYLQKPTDKLAYQMVKYRGRSGWTHRDVLRVAHPKDGDRDALFRWAVNKPQADGAAPLPSIVQGFEAARSADVSKVAALVREWGLTHEMVPTAALKDRATLEALVERMPLGALVRFLGRLSAADVLTGGSDAEAAIVARLRDADAIRKARLHPIALLIALRTYASGQGVRGKLAWRISGRVVDALNDAFYLAFENVVPSGKRHLLAIDVSGSMGWNHCAGSEVLTCSEAAAALALVTARVEERTLTLAFSHVMQHLNISPGQRLDDVLRRIGETPFGATDCAQPMLWALKRKEPVDAFVILTDNETWYGDTHPVQALRRYRDVMGIPAKLVVVAMTGTQFTIADPDDAGSLDVVGFDTAAPRVIADFIAGRV